MDVTLTLRGDQIGTFTGVSGTGNGTDRIVALDDVAAIGSSSDTFTVLVEQVNTGVTEFQNGQFITVFNSDGSVRFSRTSVQPDEEQGQAAGDEHLIVTGGSFVIDVGGVPAGPVDVTYSQADQNATAGEDDDDGNLDFAAFPCLAVGTMIETTSGLVAVEGLNAGNRIIAGNGRTRTVLWVGQRHLQLEQAGSDQRPVCFEVGSLGQGLPHRRLVVSQGHRMVLSGNLPQKMFGTDRVLAAARGLLGLPGVRLMKGKTTIAYVSVLLDEHAVMTAEGVLTESFYPGPYGMRQLGCQMRKEVAACISGFNLFGHRAYGPPAYRLLRSQEARQMVKTYLSPAKDNPQNDRWHELCGCTAVLSNP